MSSQQTKDFEVYNNDTYNGCEFEVIVNDVPLDLTGASIRMQVRKTRSQAPVISIELASGLTIVNAIAGEFQIDKQVFSAPPTTYIYDIEITLADGTIKSYIKGNFKVSGDVTHDG